MSLLSHGSTEVELKEAELTEICLPEHCFYAFDTLYCELTDAHRIDPAFPDDEYPLFVTWRTVRLGRSPKLRGCIGNFDAMPLHEGLADYALISAFKDSRFKKIEESELVNLECGVSLLTDFEDASSYLDWTIGVHGIYISFSHPHLLTSSNSTSETPSPLSSSYYLPRITQKQAFSATFLPDVIPEQGWTKVEAVDNAIIKAGWTGRITEDLRRSVKLRRYQSKHCAVGWDEYMRWRESRLVIKN